ncbi:MAG: hypothetical protein V2I97_03325 [Desulfococcaceae bacterium]|jgi:hypothetical protein|nr:hypothetical protein [Desulfococcaceae bacterium]
MTLQEIIAKIGQTDYRILLAIFLAPPILVRIISRIHPRRGGNEPPWNYIYSFFVYLVCVPGMCSCVLTAYSVFFIRQNLLNVNFAVYFLPILCMIGTLVLVGKNAEWNRLPGVDRLYALMIILVVSFGIALAIQKSRIWIVFGGTVGTLILVALFCFALLKWGSYMLFRSKDEARRDFPDYDDFRKSRSSRKSRKSAEKELEDLKRRMGMDD